MNKNIRHIIMDNIKTIFIALVIAILIRSILIQPFYIPFVAIMGLRNKYSWKP